MRICPQCKQRTDEKQCPTCKVTTVNETVLTGDDLVGRVFADRYEVISCIGRGGMGAVYRARNVALDSPVALKVLHREGAQDLESIERFYREARSASRLTHPNTIRVFDFGHSEDGRLFIAMEYLDGRSLRAEMREAGRFVEPRILRVAEQVCKSLGEAHDAGLVHRDIKPENIFLTRMYGETDFVKVLDFGIARTTEAGTLTKTGVVVGTPKYMSPEQASGRRVDGRADLYSLGVVMYEMFAGSAPFVADTSVRLLMMHLQDPPPPLSARFPGDVSSGFERLVMSLLAKDPGERMEGAREVLARIEDLKRGMTAESLTPGSPSPSQASPAPTPTPERANVAAATLVLEPDGSSPGSSGNASFGATLVLPEAPSEPTPAIGRPPVAPGPPKSPGDPAPARPRGDAPWTRWSRMVPMLLVLAAAVGVGGYYGGWWHGVSRVLDGFTRPPLPGDGTTRIALPSPWGSAMPGPSGERPSAAPEESTPAADPSLAPSVHPPEQAAGPAMDRPHLARVRLSSAPAGARVVLLPKGTDLGVTPVDLFVPAGETATLRLTRNGFRAVEVAIPFDEALKTPERTVPLPRR